PTADLADDIQDDPLHVRLVAGLGRVGQVIGHIQQRRAFVVEWRAERFGARLVQAEAALDVLERAADRQRGRDQDARLGLRKKPLAQQGRGLERSGVEPGRTVAAGARDPVHRARVSLVDAATEAVAYLAPVVELTVQLGRQVTR